MLRKNRGITLVALVIIIVILLILAGISISALTNTGIFGKVKEAKERTNIAQKQENDILDEYEKQINEPSRTYIYNGGNQYIQKTGGWGAKTESNVSIDIENNEYMSAMATSGLSCMSYIMTQNTIDVSNYSKLCAEVYTIGGHYENFGKCPASFGISNTKGFYLTERESWTKYIKFIYDDTIRKYEVDISGITGDYYVGFSQYLNSKIYKVWFE